MHNTHACTDPTVTTAPTWTIEAVTRTTLKEASVFVNASRKELFPSLGYDTLLDDPEILETSCVLIARANDDYRPNATPGRDSQGAIIAAIAYIPFDYRFPYLPWPIGTYSQNNRNSEITTGKNTSASLSSSSTTNTTANSSSSSLALLATPSSTTPQPEIPSDPIKIVEVLRLFVLPQYRRHGLAASLFQSLQDHARASGVQCMYLHTHPFLPGAIRFWGKHGFDTICVDEEDEVWRTHHMQMMLGPSRLDTGR
ncbi:hypothetical protein BU25DRAFT_390357 [Macroventuria anomochaeta]|uniref:Uncharacterized protein n=1 Tax=Macroventuria anomochaeta TaxID=301207 RepID=A0ACB6S388_9PLEO|nr:uncharacterized protein BU25DRAFT_390357 [Macroventuria anomochaeta]KAF2628621.1 hypothetical protein BU25DRAFT_390357 [Macroventuria anomochaeta]